MAFVPNPVRDALLSEVILSDFEFAALIGARAQQLEDGAVPRVSVPSHVHDALLIAAEEFHRGVLPLQIKRFYYISGRRLAQKFDVSEMRLPEQSVARLRVLDASQTEDIDGSPARYHYLTEREISYTLDHVFCSDPPVGYEMHFVRPVPAPTEEIMKHTQRVVRASMTEELRRVPFPNSQYHLQVLATHLAMNYNRGLAKRAALAGFGLAEAIVDVQVLISAFHNAGKMKSAYKAGEIGSNLVKAKDVFDQDFLVFRPGYMDPFLAVVYSRKFSDVKLLEMLLEEPFPLETGSIRDSFIHSARLRVDGATWAEIGERFLRLAFDTTKLVWYEVSLQSIVKRLRRLLPPETFIIVPSMESRGCIDILARLGTGEDVDLLLKTLTVHTVARTVKKWSVTDGVRGVSGFTPDIRRVTQFVIQETLVQETREQCTYLWTIHRQEMELLLVETPFPALLTGLDEDATFHWLPTGVRGEDYSHQAHVSLSKRAVRSTLERIEEMRNVNRAAYIAMAELEGPDAVNEASARISARQLDVKQTPVGLVDALADEFAMKQDLALQTRVQEAISMGRKNVFNVNLQLLRTLGCTAESSSILQQQEADFLSRYRVTALLSEGSQFLENLRCLPAVDKRRSYPMNAKEVQVHLGMDAARLQMLRTFIKHFSLKGKECDPRHLELIVDFMFRTGSAVSLEDLGPGDVAGSVMRNAMRGRATAVFRAAGMRDMSDGVPGVLVSQMTGTRVPGGTGGVEIVPI